MAEILTYSQSLTSLTGGRGDYTMRFLRYEEVPSHIAQKVIDEAKKAREEAEGHDRQEGRHAPARARLPPDAAARRAGDALLGPGGGDWVDVCALCTDEADEHGWVREGSPTTPIVPDGRRQAAPAAAPRLRSVAAQAEHEPAASEPMLRRLTPPEQAMVEAAELFNESPFKRTVAGIAKSLGDPSVSLLPLSGTNPRSSSRSRGTSPGTSTGRHRVEPAGAPRRARLRDRRPGRALPVLERSLDSRGRVVADIPGSKELEARRSPERENGHRSAGCNVLESGASTPAVSLGVSAGRNYVGGEWVDAAGDETFESRDPASGELIGVFPRSRNRRHGRAVAAAHDAWHSWRLVPAPKRAEILFRVAQSLRRAQGRADRADGPRDGEGPGRGRRRRPGSDRHDVLHGRRGTAALRPDDARPSFRTSS